MALKFDDFTEDQQVVSARLLAMLVCGEVADFRKFPEVSQQEFEAIADATMERTAEEQAKFCAGMELARAKGSKRGVH